MRLGHEARCYRVWFDVPTLVGPDVLRDGTEIWDERLRGGGYRGWNGEAIDDYRREFGDRPLDPDLRYPELPVDLTHAVQRDDGLFSGRRSGSPTADDRFGDRR